MFHIHNNRVFKYKTFNIQNKDGVVPTIELKHQFLLNTLANFPFNCFKQALLLSRNGTKISKLI